MTKFTALAMTALVAFACGDKDPKPTPGGDDEPVVPAQVTDATAVSGAGDGEITVKFKAPDDANWDFAEITYFDLTEEEDVTKAVSSSPNSEGFYEIFYKGYTDFETTYNFDIVSVSKAVGGKRAKSEAKRVSAKAKEPDPALVETVAETLAIEPCTMGGTLSWTHTTGEKIYIRVSYKNPEPDDFGDDQMVEFDWETTTSGSFRVGSMKADNDLKVWVVTKKTEDDELVDSEVSEEVTFPSFTPGEEKRMQNPQNAGNPNDLRDYFVVKYENPNLLDPNNKSAFGAWNILHGDYGLTPTQCWHTSTTISGDTDIPFIAIFDMRTERIISSVVARSRKDSTGGPHHIQYQFSNDYDPTNSDPNNGTWVSAGNTIHDHMSQEDQQHYLQMRNPARYMKVMLMGVTAGADGNMQGYICMGYINFFGSPVDTSIVPID